MTDRINILSELARRTLSLFRKEARGQVGALCYRVRKKRGVVEVLLVTTRETHRWVIPKGWPIAGKSADQAAAQEAYEEAGAHGKVTKKPLGFFTYLKCLPGGDSVPCVVQVHALEVTRRDKHFKEETQRSVAWFPYIEAANLVVEPELKQLIMSLGNRKKPSVSTDS